ncbi:MAG: tryptophan synthase subunit alpha [Chlorobi bacterium]|nr:tryptophan synthase subunit alpha [Chlorobiota bacterium]
MNKIQQLFKNKKNILSVYFTAGYPELNDTATIIKELEKNNADLIEVGIPFSDPLADGPTIQDSSSIALKNGINPNLVFKQIQSIKNQTNIPLIIMAYLNQMIAFGEDNFLEECKKSNIQALIIPDLPISEYKKKYKKMFEEYNLSNIFLITPQTSNERILEIDELSDTFIYMVSSNSVTGTKKDIDNAQIQYFERIKNMNLKNPTLIGFGISNNKTFTEACKYANGAIIGSAFIKKISEKGELKDKISNFIKEIKN